MAVAVAVETEAAAMATLRSNACPQRPRAIPALPARLLIWLMLLTPPVSAQVIESSPLDPPSPSAGEADEAAQDGEATVEFKRAPLRDFGPDLPDPIPPVAVEQQPGAVLRLLDMMTAETRTIEMTAGQYRDLDRVRVTLAICEAPADGAAKGTRAWLRITDARTEDDGPAFEGWMFADSPALSAMDHPRYDLWLIRCTISEGAVASGSE